MPKGRVQSQSTSFEGMNMSLNAPYLLQYHRILTLPICLKHQSWYSHHSDAADIIPENQCRTSKVCCDWVERQNSAFVVSARRPTVQNPGKFILLHPC